MVGTSYDCLVLEGLPQLQDPCLGVHMEEAVIVGFVLGSGSHMIAYLTVGYAIDGSQDLHGQLVDKEQVTAAKGN